MGKILVKYNSNWADEITIEGFKIYDSKTNFENDIQKILDESCNIPTEEFITEIIEEAIEGYEEEQDEYNSIEELIEYEYSEVFKFKDKFYFSDFEIYIGTNESVEYSTIKDFLEDFECIEILNEAAEQIEKIFGTKFGIFPF